MSDTKNNCLLLTALKYAFLYIVIKNIYELNVFAVHFQGVISIIINIIENYQAVWHRLK